MKQFVNGNEARQMLGRPLLDVDGALNLTARESEENHKTYGNSGFAAMLAMLGPTRKFVKADGCYVWDSEGKKYLDFLAGYGSVSLGHNHPKLVEAMRRAEDLPNILQISLPVLSGALARNLAMISPGGLQRSFFCNSGAEAVEGALKLARATTERAKIVYTDNSFHGKTFGALSVTGREKYRKPFGPILAATAPVPFGDAAALEIALKGKDVAAFIVEPIQGEGGVVVPPEGYLTAAKELCDKYGALLIVDEIQTGFGRTGRMFACQHENVVPDVMCLSKSLGGGVMPIGAFITTDKIWQKAFGGMEKCLLHTSTFGGNSRACAAGIAAINVLVDEKLPEAAADNGSYIMQKLTAMQEKYDLIKEVRGRGLLIGIEFKEPTGGLLKAISLGVMNSLSREYLAALVAGELASKHGVIMAFTLNNPNVIRLEPPLTVSREDIDYALGALEEVLGRFKGFMGAAFYSAVAMAGSFFRK